MIRIFNTLSGQKESLPETRPVRLFVCGPTVYDYSHIGHARTYLAFDIIVRYLRHKKIPVFYLQNVTDIDDKIIDRAKKDGKKPAEIARFFEKEYYHDMKKLGVASVSKYAPASKFIKEIQQQISTLIKKGLAYQTSSGVYFEVKKFKDYGNLSKQNLETLRPGYRIEPDPEKKDSLDFALWKAKKEADEPGWPSPWGNGRPGWHIEDTAISEKFFGPQYDLHGGAVDLKFPHHESEIAQQESASGKKPFVKIWLHTGFLLVNGEKMSKSLNNFITISDFLKKYPPEILRFIIISHNYRSPVDYKDGLAKQAEQSLLTIKNFLGRLSLKRQSGPVDSKWANAVKTAEQQFETAMENDLNTPDALASLSRLMNQIEPDIWNLNKNEARLAQKFILEKTKILGFNLPKTAKIPLKIRWLVWKRELYRTHKQFIKSDALRKKIEALQYKIEDTPKGPLVWPSP